MENDKIRVQINNMMEDGYLKGFDSLESATSLTENLYDIYSTPNDINNSKYIYLNYLWMFSQTIYIDSYKYLKYKENNLILGDSEKVFFDFLKNMECEEDIATIISYSPDYYSLMICTAYEYNNLDYLTKYILLKSLNKEDNQFLNKCCPIHQNDLKKIDNFINLDALMNSYLKLAINDYNDNYEINDEDIINILKNFIKKLYIVDQNNFKLLIHEIIKLNNLYVFNTNNFINKVLYDDDYLVDLLNKTIKKYYNDDEHKLKR